MAHVLFFAILATAPSQKRDAPGHPVVVTWVEVSSTESCFFFAGPPGLGRDVELGREARMHRNGHYVTVEFAPGMRFRGKVRGSHLRLESLTKHEYEGEWQILQLIEGEFEHGSLSGEYTYNECDLSGTYGCPGACSIHAFVEIHPPERAVLHPDEAIDRAVGGCVETGLQRERAFARGGKITVVWAGTPAGELGKVTFPENSFADLDVASHETLTACVERRMRAARAIWRGAGQLTVEQTPSN